MLSHMIACSMVQCMDVEKHVLEYGCFDKAQCMDVKKHVIEYDCLVKVQCVDAEKHMVNKMVAGSQFCACTAWT